jgi:hypothetical protein
MPFSGWLNAEYRRNRKGEIGKVDFLFILSLLCTRNVHVYNRSKKMAAATARIVVQVTPQQKANIVGTAKQLEMNISDFMRRAAENFRGAPEDRDLEALLRQVEMSTQQANAAIDHALTSVTVSEQRLAVLETTQAPKTRSARRKA